MDTAESIQRYIEQELLEDSVASDDPLADQALDSIAVEELVAYLEERFGIVFEDEELAAENFSSVPTLAALVDRKRESEKEERGFNERPQSASHAR